MVYEIEEAQIEMDSSCRVEQLGRRAWIAGMAGASAGASAAAAPRPHARNVVVTSDSKAVVETTAGKVRGSIWRGPFG